MSKKRGGPWALLTATCAFVGLGAGIASVAAWPAYTQLYGDQVVVSYTEPCETSTGRRGGTTTDCQASWTLNGVQVKGILTDSLGEDIRGTEGTLTTSVWGETARTRVRQPWYLLGLVGPWALLAAIAIGVPAARVDKRRRQEPAAELAEIPVLPQDVLRFAAERGLGAPVAGYRGSTPYGWFVVAPLLFGPLGYSVFQGIETPVEYGIAGLGVLAAVWGRVKVLRKQKWLVAFFTSGVHVCTHKQEFTCGWHEATAVVASVTRSNNHTFHKYTLWRNGTESIVLEDGWAGIEEIGDRLVRDANQAMLPRYIESFESGNSLAFGEFLVDRDGIAFDDHFASWASVTEFRLANGVLEVRASGARRQFPVERLPNVPILMTLANGARSRV